jgi:hypothetical protein
MDRDVDVPEGKLPGGYTKDNVERTVKMVCDYNVCAWVLVWAFQGVEWPAHVLGAHQSGIRKGCT